HERIFAEALRRTGASPEQVLHGGDSYEADIIPARSKGWRTLWIATGGASDGEVCVPDFSTLTPAHWDRLLGHEAREGGHRRASRQWQYGGNRRRRGIHSASPLSMRSIPATIPGDESTERALAGFALASRSSEDDGLLPARGGGDADSRWRAHRRGVF